MLRGPQRGSARHPDRWMAGRTRLAHEDTHVRVDLASECEPIINREQVEVPLQILQHLRQEELVCACVGREAAIGEVSGRIGIEVPEHHHCA